MAISPFAGKRATRDMLVDLAKLEGEYYARTPDMGDPNQAVAFAFLKPNPEPISKRVRNRCRHVLVRPRGAG